jgi:hypothetical protein
MTASLKGKVQDSMLPISCGNGDGQLQYISWPLSLIKENSFHI